MASVTGMISLDKSGTKAIVNLNHVQITAIAIALDYLIKRGPIMPHMRVEAEELRDLFMAAKDRMHTKRLGG